MQRKGSQLAAGRAVRGMAQAALLASLSVTAFFWMQREASDLVLQTFDYGEERFADYGEVRREWRPRIGATSLVRAFHTTDAAGMRRRIALFFALGFLATGLSYRWIDRRAAPFMQLGSFAALVYAGTPVAENTWHPWDVPALLFGSLTLLFAVRRRPWLLAAAILAAVPFKETLLTMALLFCCFDGRSWRWRLGWTGGVLAAGVLLRLGIERAVDNPLGLAAFSYHVNANPEQALRIRENLEFLISPTLNHLAWANAGMLLLVFLLPTQDRVLRGFKGVVAVFYAGIFVAGSCNEFRVFLEVLPGSLLLLAGTFGYREPAPPHSM
jgi:hypothetical protein